MMRTRFSAWIATNPIAKPISLFLNGAGKAKIAANRMISASTPLQPGSMETANPDSRSRMTFPAEATPESNSSMMFTLIRKSGGKRQDHVLLHRLELLDGEQTHQQNHENNEKPEHARSRVAETPSMLPNQSCARDDFGYPRRQARTIQVSAR